MELDEAQRAVLAAIDGARGRILSVSRCIHEHPELGRQETFASSLVAETLEAAGFVLERGYAGIPTALIARKAGGKGSGKAGGKGPRVAFLAEYDALPGLGHGCGHNLITAAAIGAGMGLGAVIDSIAGDSGGEVVVMGTPAEETDGAKVSMVAQGCFDDIDAALMVHPYDGNFSEVESLAMDAIELRFFGKSAHAAASPWDGLNALDAVIQTFNGINALRQHLRPDARIHGIITDGGQAPNVVPERATARFYVRARRRDYLDQVVQKFKACAEAAAMATGTRLETANYELSFDDMASNGPLSDRFRDYMTGALASGPFRRAPDSFGSLDMGNVSHVVPAVHALVDITGGTRMSLHTPEFRDAAISATAEDAIIRAAKALALSGLDILRNPDLLESARADFRNKLGYAPKGRFRNTISDSPIKKS